MPKMALLLAGLAYVCHGRRVHVSIRSSQGRRSDQIPWRPQTPGTGRSVRELVLALDPAAGAATSQGPWTPASLSRYVSARAGAGKQSFRIWRGHGSLKNTLTGARIADVDFIERCERLQDDDNIKDDTYRSERVLVYRNNRTMVSRPLRYIHNVSIAVTNGNLLLRAMGAGNKAIASGWGIGRGLVRTGPFRSHFEISVRPAKGDTAASTQAPERTEPTGWPRAANTRSIGALREEYRLEEPPRGLGALLQGVRRPCFKYKRTGQCPHWYGPGVCTLEVVAHAEGDRKSVV